MRKRFKNLFYVTDNIIISEDSLKNKSLEELIIEKDNQHDVISIIFPIVISLAWIIISSILSLKPQAWEQNSKILTDILSILTIISVIIAILIFIWVVIIVKNIIKEHKAISQNLEIYDKEIFKRLKAYKESDEKFKKEVSDSLKEIKEKL